jgi:hypothetical protein
MGFDRKSMTIGYLFAFSKSSGSIVEENYNVCSSVEIRVINTAKTI